MSSSSSSSAILATTWNPDDKATNLILSNGDLTVGWSSGIGSGQLGVRATVSKSSGRWYFEIIVPSSLTWDINYVGVATLSETLTYPGDSVEGWGYKNNNGKKYHSSSYTYGDEWEEQDDVTGVAVDLNQGYVWFSKNGIWQDGGRPSIGDNPAFTSLTGKTVYPMVSVYTDFTIGELQAITGMFASVDMIYSIPTLFSAWDD